MESGARSVVCACVLVSCLASVEASADAELRQCQKLKDRIEHYDQLRRKGGAQMDNWKRARRDLEKQFRDLKCRYYRLQFK